MIVKRGVPGLAALEKSNPSFSGVDVYELARAGDSDARMIFEIVGRALGIGLASLVNALNLPLYVVGGVLADAWNSFSPRCVPNFIIAVMFTA